MYVKCWQCGEQLEASSIEKQVYKTIVNDLRKMLCDNAKDDVCDIWWRHEDCHVVGNLIEQYKPLAGE